MPILGLPGGGTPSFPHSAERVIRSATGLGAGVMRELGDVAIKILPEAFAHDAGRLARFTPKRRPSRR